MAKPSRKQRKKSTARQDTGPTMAEQADRHVYYQESVQNAETEIDFVDETFEKIRGRKMSLLREDFSGTSQVCCEWVRRRPDNRAIGVDLDPEVLQWGREHNLSQLNADQLSRVTLLEDNVLTVTTEPMDTVLAMNFSYWCFKDRDTLRSYFKRIHEVLKDDGVFFLDCFGGYEAFRLLEESTEHDNFTYTWDQSEYNPINGDYVCHIHFEFPDGSKLKEAFTYEWRLWTMPELHELLKEAGFVNVQTYWEGEDEDGEGDGNYEPTDVGDADAGWVCYIVAEK
ncbi:class I SAM-dependent methyltransferase [Sulfuriflexus sp.]|uniref:class I SAM-dependent methyltransferase n=1 Tax=Sulfuriflexus sp. TaxID=2015443 RepID=UPI0028CE213E|nr:class I SAM-dependent methyltransferase [Sulfuriflexus sp.]MDT8403898.1 class I SAM-dependent methyltransferase [Sulfuriflexus sp.]